MGHALKNGQSKPGYLDTPELCHPGYLDAPELCHPGYLDALAWVAEFRGAHVASQEGCHVPSEKVHVSHKHHSGLSRVLLATSSVSSNQQHTLKKVSLSRNTHKQGYILIGW